MHWECWQALILVFPSVFLLSRLQGYIPYDTCQPYLACSNDSTHGFCGHIDTTCSQFNTCRTCYIKLPFMKRVCKSVKVFPNATIEEFGVIRYDESKDELDDVVHQIKAEVIGKLRCCRRLWELFRESRRPL